MKSDAKTLSNLIMFVASLILSLGVQAQSYTIDWFTIDGGGGTSTGGTYSVSGTIGQSDASMTSMTGGRYSVTGGFWSLCVVQIPGAPTLKIVQTGPDQVTISWAPDTSGWVLLESQNLSPSDWVFSSSSDDNPVTIPIPQTTKFYRLSRP
ncbi:MAG: hypothetical protein O7C75_00995 [Verrucomicrobia bacterium]|nr:hypothetical protein [Verrucomicrobiota bacterium]